jgi:nucleoside-diphosphate-sugar epimerase
VTAQELVDLAREHEPEAPLTFNTDPLLGPVSKISAKWDLSIKAAEEDLDWRPAFTVDSMAEDLMATAREQRRQRSV